MKTKTINLYSFDELSEEAKKTAIKANRDINVNYQGWADSEICYWRDEKLVNAGFLNANIYYSGFSNQGDGACFDAEIDISKFTDNKRLLNLASKCNFYISKKSIANHYSHERTRYVDFESPVSERQNNVHKALSDLCQFIEAKRLQLSKEIYSELEEAYTHYTSDSAIIETFEDNEYTFTEDGKLENL